MGFTFSPVTGYRDTEIFKRFPTDPRDDMQDLLDQIKAYLNKNAVYCADTGTADAMVVTLDPAPTAYSTDMFLIVKKGSSANTGALVVNANALGVKSVKKDVSVALGAGDAPANGILFMQYDGTNFQLLNPSFASHLEEYVSFTRFGGIGDDDTDNTTFFNNAVDYLVTKGGGTLLIPQGTFLGDFVIDSSNIHIVGMGRGLSILKKKTSEATTQCVYITASNCSVENLTVLGQTVASYLASECGIKIYGADDANRVSNINIDNVEVYNIGAYGIRTDYGENVKVQKCYVHDCGYAGITFFSTNNGKAMFNEVEDITPGTATNEYGIYFTNITGESNCNGGGAYFNKIKNITTWEALDTHGGQKIDFIGNEVYSCLYGVNISADDGGIAPNYCKVIGNTLDIGALTLGRGIGAGGAVADSAEGLIISDNIVIGYCIDSNANEGAIMFRYTKDLIIKNNYLKGSIGRGINLYSDNANVNVAGNTIVDLATGSAGTTVCLAVRSTNNTGFIAGNVLNAGTNYCILISQNSPGLEFGRNFYLTSGTEVLSGANGDRGLEIYGSGTVDPSNLADGAGEVKTISVVGAELGDEAYVTAPYDLQGITVTGYVSAVNTVSIRLQNETGGDIDLASGTWKSRVVKR